MDHDSPTLRQGLAAHLADEGFSPDGGAADRWATLRIGPVPFCIPNLAVRRKALLPHDCNHLLSGYGHDLIGESQISAWELGGGLGGEVAAWFLAWPAVLPGTVLAPRRTFAAFVRGRRTGNLFGTDLDALLDEPIAALRASMGLEERHRATPADAVAFAGRLVLAPLMGLVPLALSVVTSPAWLLAGAHRRRRLPRNAV